MQVGGKTGEILFGSHMIDEGCWQYYYGNYPDKRNLKFINAGTKMICDINYAMCKSLVSAQKSWIQASPRGHACMLPDLPTLSMH